MQEGCDDLHINDEDNLKGEAQSDCAKIAAHRKDRDVTEINSLPNTTLSQLERAYYRTKLGTGTSVDNGARKSNNWLDPIVK